MTRAPSVEGFPPIASEDARVLILGSLPSEELLRRQQYFARKTNAFWPIMGLLCGASPDRPYLERCARLKDKGIALWDVCRSARRAGSLDASIMRKTMVPNDFMSFLRAHPQIACICFAGRAAEDLYRIKVLTALPADLAAIPRRALPSTSPAHASMRFEEKTARWRQILAEFASIDPF